MFKKTYELSLNKSYVRHWGFAEAVRELIQNALDSAASFEYSFMPDLVSGDDGDEPRWTFTLTSKGVTLSPTSLLLGSTTKAKATDKIGSFGEGYKIALLVLTRLGIAVEILNGHHLWNPVFKHSNVFDDDILCIRESQSPKKSNDLVFCVCNLDESQISDIRASCLKMQEVVGEVKHTKYGDILLERPGKLYVGSLYICDTDLKFGYDIHPRYISLERDRKTVDNWDLKTITRDMWYDTQEWANIAQMIEVECPDVEYARWSSPELVKEACYQLFREKNPGKLIATSQDELRRMVKSGMSQTIYVGSNFGAVAAESRTYRAQILTKISTPYDILATWYAESKYHMHEKIRAPFQQILDQSKSWKS